MPAGRRWDPFLGVDPPSIGRAVGGKRQRGRRRSPRTGTGGPRPLPGPGGACRPFSGFPCHHKTPCTQATGQDGPAQRRLQGGAGPADQGGSWRLAGGAAGRWGEGPVGAPRRAKTPAHLFKNGLAGRQGLQRGAPKPASCGACVGVHGCRGLTQHATPVRCRPCDDHDRLAAHGQQRIRRLAAGGRRASRLPWRGVRGRARLQQGEPLSDAGLVIGVDNVLPSSRQTRVQPHRGAGGATPSGATPRRRWARPRARPWRRRAMPGSNRQRR